jgi:hypothetical protein
MLIDLDKDAALVLFELLASREEYASLLASARKALVDRGGE